MAFNGRIPEGQQARVVTEEELVIGSAEVVVEREHRAPAKPHQMAADAPCFDYMVDIETTGTNAQENAILQIACVRFNRLTKRVDHNWFDRCLVVPPGRYWSEDTRDWWMKQPSHVLGDIMARAEPAAKVMQDFHNWVTEGSVIMPRVFWAKPITFDYPFIASYMRQFGHMMPFHYREAVDVNSYLLGRGHDNRFQYWKGIESVGDAHNAVNDCLYQIRAVLGA